jgi:hypothetical protein
MNRAPQLTIVAALALCAMVGVSWQSSHGQRTDMPSTTVPSGLKVSISTGGGLFGPPKDSYRVGQQIPVTITMTNTSDQPVQVCVSGTLYQDRPNLSRDGRALTYVDDQLQALRASKMDKPCLELDQPEPITVQPKQSRVVDWFILVDDASPTGAMAWYDRLQPGKYDLSIQRRLSCCDGPMVESNKISFEVVP